MSNLYKTINQKFLIHILLLFQFFLSKQSKIHQSLSNETINKPYKVIPHEELYKKYEELPYPQSPINDYFYI